MEDKSPVGVVLVPLSCDIRIACISGALLKKHLASAVVAVTSPKLKLEEIDELQQVFDFVITAPKLMNQQRDIDDIEILLLHCISLTTFRLAVVVQPGVLVFQNLKASLKNTGIILNKLGMWKVIALTPSRSNYIQINKLLSTGKINKTNFMKTLFDNGIITQNESSSEIVHCWSELKFYIGNKLPCIQITAGMLSFLGPKLHLHKKSSNVELESPWEKIALRELATVKDLICSSSKAFNLCDNTRFHEKTPTSWIAIVGMSCRFPNANSVEEYWEVLTSGQNTATYPPSHRLEKCQLSQQMRANFLKCRINEFDASFFGIPPSEASVTDVQARLLLEVSWEAFEDAAINPEKLRGSPVGVYSGSWLQDYRDAINLTQRPDEDFIRKYIGNGFGCTAAKLSYFYGFTGPNIATESGCSSSMAAVELASQSLQLGNCPVALATGVNVILQMDPNTRVLLAEDGICKSFDSKANGYGRGEGVAVLVLKRYSDALQNGDRIHGIIRGSAMSQEGLSKSFGAPTVLNETATMTKALASAQLNPCDIDYVEAHATGTGVGDPIEAEAIVRAYSGKREYPLLIGSGKTNIGHTESCSGIAAIIKVLLALKHETIPPHINLNTINPKVDFSSIPGRIVLENTPWKRSLTKQRVAGISNFGITGTDLHMIIQEPPEQQIHTPQGKKTFPLYILALSAKTKGALKELSEAYTSFLEYHSNYDMNDVAYTTTVCRAHHSIRRAVIGKNREEIIQRLKRDWCNEMVVGEVLNICFIFHDNLNVKDFEQVMLLYHSNPTFQAHMFACDALCNELSGFSPLCQLLTKLEALSTINKEWQLCAFSVTYSLYKLWESWGVKGNFVVGHNFGEIAGAVVAGKLTLIKGFQIILGLEMDHVSDVSATKIKFISSASVPPGLNIEHWRNICLLSKAGIYSSVLESIIVDLGCNVFIEVGMQRKLNKEIVSTKANNKLDLYLPKGTKVEKSIQGGVRSIYNSLCLLYTNGYQIDWEGVYWEQECSKISLPHYPFQRRRFWFKMETLNHLPNHSSYTPTFNHLHPLLGKYVPSNHNSKNTHTFESAIVAQEQLHYLSHHRIGCEVIFPAAAFVEMLLAANCLQGESMKGPAFTVQNFHIQHPLCLNVGQTLRTVMSKEADMDLTWKIIIEAKVKSDDNKMEMWKQYASGEVSILSSIRLAQITIEHFKNRCIEKENAGEVFYSKIAKAGLSFGNSFQSLKRIFQCEGETMAEVSIPLGAVQYICHPVLTDAMIQCYIFHKNPTDGSLQVPVSIRKFECYRCLSPYECSSAFDGSLHVYYNEEVDTVYLFDHKNNMIASMVEPVFKTTTIETIMATAGIDTAEDTVALDTYKIEWKRDIKFQSEFSLEIPPHSDFTTSPNYRNRLEVLSRRNRFTKREKELDSRVTDLCQLYILKAFYELEWKPKLGQNFTVSEFASQLKILDSFKPAFRHYIGYLVGKVLNSVETSDEPLLTVKTVPEDSESVENSIAKLLAVLSDYGPIDIINSCGSQLASALQGRIKGKSILFSGEDENGLTPVGRYYNTMRFYSGTGKALPKIFIEISRHLASLGCRGKLRILEIGAGLGVFTKDALQLLEEDGSHYQYFFTDLSYNFLKKAATAFSNYGEKFTFKTLDIEKDPLSQGFTPNFFDIVVALDVLHATTELNVTLNNLQKVVKNGGILIIGETNKPIPEFDIVFGILEGYWMFKDFKLRPSHCTISAHKWLNLLHKNGFSGPSSKLLLVDSNLCAVVGSRSHERIGPDATPSLELKNAEKTWLLLHDFDKNVPFLGILSKKLAELERDLLPFSIHNFSNMWDFENLQTIIREKAHFEGILCIIEGKHEYASSNCRAVLEPLLVALQHIQKRNWHIAPKLCVTTFGAWRQSDEDDNAQNPSTATLWGFVRCVRVETPGLSTKLIDVEPEIDVQTLINTLFQEMWLRDDETEVMYRNNVRYVRRLNRILSEAENVLFIPLPEGRDDDYTIQLPNTKLLTDLTFVSKKLEKLERNCVIVEVRSSSLNFRDIFSVMKPTEAFKHFNSIGLDFSGVVKAVGEDVSRFEIGTPVFGVSWEKSSVSGHVMALAQHLEKLPKYLTFSEAVTLPVAFLTAWYSIVHVANASAGKTILIHAASGGVGLLAVQIAKIFGLHIIATAGNSKKRKYLKNLGIVQVFSSRNLEFGEKIKEFTRGEGVDIILNCLTGPGFKEASLEVCKVGGYFVEISKLDIWEEQDVNFKKPGVIYKAVDLTITEPTVLSSMMKCLCTLIERKEIHSLPFRRYTASRVIHALNFLQKAKHIGKVVVEMPTFDLERKCFKEALFNDRSSYLITGGKGAIGLAIAEWMVVQGAKYIVLLGRSLSNHKVLNVIRLLEEDKGARIICKEVDVADFEECKKVINDIQKDPNLPPLRGVHNCAGVLSDGMIISQDWANFEHVLNPKVKGVYNMHVLTLELPLEFFVVHSSMTSTFGNVGQSNYAAGNSYMEALVEKRCAIGLPGMSVSWGQWKAGLAEHLNVEILKPFSLAKGLDTLQNLFVENREATVAGVVKIYKMMNHLPIYEKTLLENLKDIVIGQQIESIAEKKLSFLETYSKADGDKEKNDVILKFVKDVVGETLGVKPDEINGESKFTNMGMDSLLSIEFYNRIQTQLGEVDLGFVDMEQYGSANEIGGFIKNALEIQLN